jgi:hypothetical protein
LALIPYMYSLFIQKLSWSLHGWKMTILRNRQERNKFNLSCIWWKTGIAKRFQKRQCRSFYNSWIVCRKCRHLLKFVSILIGQYQFINSIQELKRILQTCSIWSLVRSFVFAVQRFLFLWKNEWETEKHFWFCFIMCW